MTIKQIREQTLRARHLMQRARRQHFAVGAFNIDNQETLIAVARAATKLNSPVMVEASHGEVEAMGLDNIRDMVDNYRAEYGIEMYINLDHSPSVEAAKAGIDAGFEFIHIDISNADHSASDAEIIAGTREIVEYAKFTGAIVEAEPHYFQGSSNLHTEKIDYQEIKKTFSTPEGALEFVQATGIETFAASIGNLHGKYAVPKKLDLELLSEIRRQLPAQVNISLHGGSGMPEHYYIDAAKIGVQKININSDMRLVFRQTLEKVLNENPNEYAIVKLMPEVYIAVQKVVEKKIQAFGSEGRAVL
ncbi:MAG: class II fructose-bisphosphate aldolase [Candidatus Nomurabacteria bacterium]|jgi:ketose-bisphosphate aldolase|nr:class II fructose-bisphosphate aldolase [Candidatus Nomurabacteria bacterium]